MIDSILNVSWGHNLCQFNYYRRIPSNAPLHSFVTYSACWWLCMQWSYWPQHYTVAAATLNCIYPAKLKRNRFLCFSSLLFPPPPVQINLSLATTSRFSPAVHLLLSSSSSLDDGLKGKSKNKQHRKLDWKLRGNPR